MELNQQVPPSRSRKRFIVFCLLLGALAAAAFGCYHRFYVSRPIGEGPAGPQVKQDSFDHVWTSRPILLIGLGDSVTAGFGARQAYGYFDRLVKNPSDEFPEMNGVCLSAVFSHLRVTNLAVSGSVSSELAESQLPRLPAADSNTLVVIVMTTGGNDLIHNYGRTPPRELAMYGAHLDQAKPWIGHFEERLELIYDKLNSHFPAGCHIFIANIYDPTDDDGDIERAGLPSWPDGPKLLSAYNHAINLCAEKHPNVHVINMHNAFLGHGLHCTQFWSKHYHSDDPHYWYYENLEDPNERGYDAIHRLFLLEIAKVPELKH